MVKSIVKSMKPRERDTHKGDYGHLFVLAGAMGFTGAAYLTSQASLLSGSGLVTLGIPESLNDVMELKLTEVMTLPLKETGLRTLSTSCEKQVLSFASKISAIAMGPGLSRNSDTQRLIRSLVSKITKPLVLDADGINAFEGLGSKLRKRRCQIVITPHPGEMSRLIGKKTEYIQKNRVSVAKKFSKEINGVVVLKGHKTVVAYKDMFYINESGNPGMATGGVGDVLTGIIASLIGQGLDPFGAAKLGCYVHGLAGDLAVREKGEISLTATDILSYLPKVFKKL